MNEVIVSGQTFKVPEQVSKSTLDKLKTEPIRTQKATLKLWQDTAEKTRRLIEP